MYIFCTRSIQVSKGYKTLAIQLHEGRDICLSKLILGSLYESLNQAVTSIKEYQSGSNLIIPAPIWLFQLWLLATFRTKLKVFLPNDFQEEYNNRSNEGICLTMLRCENTNSKELFTIAYEALFGCDVLTPSFSTRTCGPDWFTRKFPATKVEDKAETNALWQAYLTHTFLSSRASDKASNTYGLCGYQPNLVARQFGLVQPKPSSLYICSDDLKKPQKENTWRVLLQQVQGQTPIFKPAPFALSYACTEAFLDGGKSIIGSKLVK